MAILRSKDSKTWVDIPPFDFQLLCRRLTQADQAAARAAQRQALDNKEDEHREYTAEVALNMTLLKRSVMDWRNVSDEAGKAIPFSPERFDDLCDEIGTFNAIYRAVIPSSLLWVEAKNGSSPVSNGP